MNKLIKIASLAFALTLITSCSPVKIKPIETYTLSAYPSNATPSRASTKLTLLVTTPIASPGYQTDAMVYIKTPYQLQQFASHKWIAPPAHMIMPILTKALESKHYFYAVVESPFTGNASYRLDTKLLTLQQEFLLPQSQIRVVIQASLLNNTTNQITASQMFTLVIPTTANTPYSGVLSTTEAVNSLANQIATFVVRSAH